jgi:hypothetical protein
MAGMISTFGPSKNNLTPHSDALVLVSAKESQIIHALPRASAVSSRSEYLFVLLSSLFGDSSPSLHTRTACLPLFVYFGSLALVA